MIIMKDHVLLIWNSLDIKFKRNILEPDTNTNYNRFLKLLNK